MYSVQKSWRSNNSINMYDPRKYAMENYFTDARQKREMKHSFGDELLNNLHLLPDPLKKNLADSIITEEKPKQKNMLNTPEEPKMDPISSFAGITNFFSSVVNVISGAMSHWRPKSPAQYYDCLDESQQRAPLWQAANSEVQNKPARETRSNTNSDMNGDCKEAVAHCEDKLNKVRLLLSSKPVETRKVRPRRPKKQFVEAGVVEEQFEDAFSSEDFSLDTTNHYIEHCSLVQTHCEGLCEAAAPKIKTQIAPLEATDVVRTLEDTTDVKVDSNANQPQMIDNTNTVVETKAEELTVDKPDKEELVSSCEDKLSKLKALLQEKRMNNKKPLMVPDSTPEPEVTNKEKHPQTEMTRNKIKDKRFKNPNRTTNKRRKCKIKRSIQEDLLFGNEIHSEEVSSVENSPSICNLDRLYHSHNSNTSSSLSDTPNTPVEYFDEVSGRFHSTSTTDSEDSFQIVFNDSPKESLTRQLSECESEDSFIVFEDSPDSCYTSNDVFGDSDDSDSIYTDSESELSDTEDVPSRLPPTLSRTFSDLTENCLYDKPLDETDSAVRTCEVPTVSVTDVDEETSVVEKSTGLLLTPEKKLLRKNLPQKNVST
jgi:hypothetical protein